MSDGGLTVLDGASLRAVEPRLPDTNCAVKGAQVMETAEAAVSSTLFGLSLPERLRSNALKRMNTDAVTFRDGSLDGDEASKKLREYVNAIADELDDEPIVVWVLDGKLVRMCLEDEDDFAMLAENLFTELDEKETGKVGKREIGKALDLMGLDMGVPPLSEFPALNDILKKHGAEGDEMLGQAQFAGLLQQVLQDLANELAANHVVIIQKIRIINSSRLKELLADENQMKNVAHDIFKDVSDGKVKSSCLERIKLFLEKFLDLPSVEANESVYLFYEQVFTDILDGESDVELEIDGFGAMVKDILKKSAELLDANPIFQNVHH